MRLSNTLVVLDLETTGTWIDKDKIVEIAMIKCQPDGTEETYTQRVNPGMPIPKAVTEIIGITDADVSGAPTFKDIAVNVVDFIGQADIGGFNVERFDLPLLERELHSAGQSFVRSQFKVFDAQKVYHVNEKRDLSAAYQFYCQRSLENAHSALADTAATLEVLKGQWQQYGQEQDTLDVLQQFDYRASAEFFDAGRRFRWWNGQLYMMFGKYARKYSLKEVVQRDRKYLEWILSADFSTEVKDLIENALQGKFPKQEM